jgi:hypothetical protein
MPQRMPEQTLLWTHEVNGENAVVAVTSTPDVLHEGQRLWCPKLDRWGVVDCIAPACIFVKIEPRP